MTLNDIFKITFGMTKTKRYSTSILIKEENVLEHTGFVTLFSFLVSHKLKKEGFKIDPETTMIKSLVHDLDEIVTGDVVRPTKDFSYGIKDGLEKMANDQLQKFEKKIGLPLSFFREFYENKNEGLVVKIADDVAVLHKVWIEFNLGNKQLFEVVRDYRKIFDGHKEKIKRRFGESCFLIGVMDECIELIYKMYEDINFDVNEIIDSEFEDHF